MSHIMKSKHPQPHSSNLLVGLPSNEDPDLSDRIQILLPEMTGTLTNILNFYYYFYFFFIFTKNKKLQF